MFRHVCVVTTGYFMLFFEAERRKLLFCCEVARVNIRVIVRNVDRCGER